MVTLIVKKSFCAAHRLLGVPICERLHGHTWHVQAEYFGRVGEDSMVRNFKDIKKEF